MKQSVLVQQPQQLLTQIYPNKAFLLLLIKLYASHLNVTQSNTNQKWKHDYRLAIQIM